MNHSSHYRNDYTTIPVTSITQTTLYNSHCTDRVDGLVLGEANRGNAVQTHSQHGDQQVDKHDPVGEERPAETHNMNRLSQTVQQLASSVRNSTSLCQCGLPTENSCSD